jgi:hypothetical protein
VYSVVVGVVIAGQRIPYRAAFDQKLYHLPVIREFARTWPTFETWDYLSATTPGYHIVMATVAKVCGDGTLPLQIATAIITGVMLWLLARDADKRLYPLAVVAVCLPIIASPYTLFPAAFILPDNLGWLGVVGMTLIALRAPTRGVMLAGGLVLCGLVLTRQVHAWTAGLLWVSAWLGPVVARRDSGASWIGAVFQRPGERVGRVAVALAVSVPALVLLGLFVRYWGGLVPGRFAEQIPPATLSRVVGSAAPAMVLSMLGAYSVFFFGFLAWPLRKLWQERRGVLIAAALAGVVLSVIPYTTADFDAGRRGVLWSIGMKGPVVAGRSVVVSMLSAWGAVCGTTWLLACNRRDRTVLLAALVGFTVSQLPSQQLWHRYFDPFVMIWLVFVASRAARAGVGVWERVARVIGPGALAAGLLAYSTTMFFETGLHAAQNMSDPAPPSKDPEGLHRGIDPPVDKLPTPKPMGKVFWGW